MAYPILLIVIGSFAVTFLMVFFIPRFSEIFKKMDDSLPLPTQIVMAISYFLRDPETEAESSAPIPAAVSASGPPARRPTASAPARF